MHLDKWLKDKLRNIPYDDSTAANGKTSTKHGEGATRWLQEEKFNKGMWASDH